MGSEATFLYKTLNSSSPEGKPRVFFTCHPDDFGKHFEKICGDVLQAQDCAIYYTEDPNADLSSDNNVVDLERMNLFVIPVTFALLSRHCRAIDSDLAFAAERKIPVLPFMMEPGLDALYSKPDKFGERQYIDPFSNDLTAISYDKKLRDYLNSVLIDDELARKVRNAFDAYIFLSYRKKDRKQANELMKKIHADHVCRNVAVWFDEFLVPGESFKENIDKMLDDSKLFALLVTPNLLEKQNFVMSCEYPAAKAAGKPILPAEMERTDKDELDRCYDGIPECVDVYDAAAFRERFLESIKRVAVSRSSDDPEHNYLIGLAYLDGIDVEVDVDRGVELITSAAEGGCPDAMKWLYMRNILDDCFGTAKEAEYWAHKLVEYYTASFGEEHSDTIIAMSYLANAYRELRDFHNELELRNKIYSLCRKMFGEEHKLTIVSIEKLATANENSGNIDEAIELYITAYDISCKLYKGFSSRKLLIIYHLEKLIVKLGLHHEILPIMNKVYYSKCEIFGGDSTDALASLSNLTAAYEELGEYQSAAEHAEKLYNAYLKLYGAEDSKTLRAKEMLDRIEKIL